MDHFADIGKMVELGSGSAREVDDMMLSGYACYRIYYGRHHLRKI
ncbi:hypothetical protein [Cellulosilyticum sp. I15G10I2]|nr:hypothetical protein [Cellulosilyticum sp. I15G10I2]